MKFLDNAWSKIGNLDLVALKGRTETHLIENMSIHKINEYLSNHCWDICIQNVEWLTLKYVIHMTCLCLPLNSLALICFGIKKQHLHAVLYV